MFWARHALAHCRGSSFFHDPSINCFIVTIIAASGCVVNACAFYRVIMYFTLALRTLAKHSDSHSQTHTHTCTHIHTCTNKLIFTHAFLWHKVPASACTVADLHSGYWDAGLELFGDGGDSDERLQGLSTSFADWATPSTDTELDATYSASFDGILCSYVTIPLLRSFDVVTKKMKPDSCTLSFATCSLQSLCRQASVICSSSSSSLLLLLCIYLD